MKRLLLIIVFVASCLSAQSQDCVQVKSDGSIVKSTAESCANSAVAPPPSGLTREAVEKRITELEQGKQQLIANLTATDGAIQENKIWLAKLKEAEEAINRINGKPSLAGWHKPVTPPKAKAPAAPESKP